MSSAQGILKPSFFSGRNSSPCRFVPPFTCPLDQTVGLKYCSATMRCDEVIDGDGGSNSSPVELRCSLGDLASEVSENGAVEKEVGVDDEAVGAKKSRPKGNISWVPEQGTVRAEVRLYDHLFTVDSPDYHRWESQVRVTTFVGCCKKLLTRCAFAARERRSSSGLTGMAAMNVYICHRSDDDCDGGFLKNFCRV